MTAIFDTADSAYVDTDEGRFQLHIIGSDGQHYIFDIHADAVKFYENVQAELGGWAREAMDARRAVAAGVSLAEYTNLSFDEGAECENAAAELGEDGYALDDPKHPTYYDRMVD